MTTAVNFAGPPGPQVMPVIPVLRARADSAAARQALNACVLEDGRVTDSPASTI